MIDTIGYSAKQFRSRDYNQISIHFFVWHFGQGFAIRLFPWTFWICWRNYLLRDDWFFCFLLGLFVLVWLYSILYCWVCLLKARPCRLTFGGIVIVLPPSSSSSSSSSTVLGTVTNDLNDGRPRFSPELHLWSWSLLREWISPSVTITVLGLNISKPGSVISLRCECEYRLSNFERTSYSSSYVLRACSRTWNTLWVRFGVLFFQQ